MEALSTCLKLEVWFLLAGLALIVVYQILTGKINTDKMLFDKSPDGGFSPGRVQLLVLTITSAFYYINQASLSPGRLPEVSQELLLIVGGSNVLYLGGKAAPILRSLFRTGANDQP